MSMSQFRPCICGRFGIAAATLHVPRVQQMLKHAAGSTTHRLAGARCHWHATADMPQDLRHPEFASWIRGQ